MNQYVADHGGPQAHNQRELDISLVSKLACALAEEDAIVARRLDRLASIESSDDLFVLWDDLRTQLSAHTDAEIDVLYGPLYNVDELKPSIEHAMTEQERLHALIDDLDEAVCDPKQFRARLPELRRCVETHVQTERTAFLPITERAVPRATLDRIHHEYVQRKQMRIELFAGICPALTTD